MNGLHLASLISVNMFVLVIIFSLKYPYDDGKCSKLSVQDQCLAEKMYNGDSFCTWVDRNVWTGCYRVNELFDITTLTLIAGLHLLLVAPLEAFINFSFDKFLYPPLINTLKIKNECSNVYDDDFTNDLRPVVPAIESSLAQNGKRFFKKRTVINMNVMTEFLDLRKKAFDVLQINTNEKQDFNNIGVKDYDDFVVSFNAYRSDLSEQKRIELDGRWTAMLNHHYHIDANHFITFKDEQMLKDEIEKTHLTCDQIFLHMKHSLAYTAGGELMKLFLLDILGRDTSDAVIFKQIIDKELRPEIAVSRILKYTFVALILLMNLYFMYATTLYSKGTSYDWQFNWVQLFVINIGFDIMIGQPFKVYLLQYIIPMSINDKIFLVKKTIDNLVRVIIKNSKYIRSKKLNLFSVSDYFFISSRIASRRPDLLESFFVLSYRSPFPTKQLQHEIPRSSTHDNKNSYQFGKNRLYGIMTMINIILNGIKSLIFTLAVSPSLIQNLVLDIIKPLFPLGVIIMCYNIQQYKLLYICVGVLALILLYLIYRGYKFKDRILPLNNTEVHDDHVMYDDYYDKVKMPPAPMNPGTYPSHILDDEKADDGGHRNAPPPKNPGEHPMLFFQTVEIPSLTADDSLIANDTTEKVDIKTAAQLTAHLKNIENQLFNDSSESSDDSDSNDSFL